MDRDSREAFTSSPHSASPTAAGAGRSSTVRIKSTRHASSDPSFSLSDDQSLTSFPSLTPSLANFPQTPNKTLCPPTGLRASANGTSALDPTYTAPASFEGLFNSTGASDGRTALFEDAANRTRSVPGNLHHQADEHVEHLVSRMGPIHLIKQLAGDLARRDAEVTLSQRRAEERERLLRKMLKECGVSSQDIDHRIRDSDDRSLEYIRQHQAWEAHEPLVEQALNGTATRPESPMETRLSEAFEHVLEDDDNLGFDREVGRPFSGRDADSYYSTDQDVSATVRRVTSEKAEPTLTKARHWKNYFRPSGSSSAVKSPSRQMSQAQQQLSAIHSAAKLSERRKGLSNDLFRPPPADDDSYDSETSQRQTRFSKGAKQKFTDTESIESSSSVTSWAARLVAGQTPPERGTLDPRNLQLAKSQIAKAQDFSIAHSRQVMPAPSGNATRGPDRIVFQNGSPIPTGLNGTMQQANADRPQQRLPGTLASNSARDLWDATSAEAGPVEMDTILPDETRPPTLTTPENLDNSPEFLTDRFGFIYDQRRRRRQSEAAAQLKSQRQGSRVETLENHRRSLNALANDEDLTSLENAFCEGKSSLEAPMTATDDGDNDRRAQEEWQDHLKLSKRPTELLSHTPLPVPITSIVSPEAQGEAGDRPGQSVSSVPRLVSHLTPHSISSTQAFEPAANATGECDESKSMEKSAEPVQSLLDSLTQLHDSTQKEKTAKWNDFLRKVRAEKNRQCEGAVTHHRSKSQVTPETSLTNGEVVGVAGLGNRGKIGRAKWNEFRNLVLGGIPVAFRAKIWAECSGASSLRVPGYYKELVEDGSSDPIVVQQIHMDITRTLTDNIFFRRGQGVSKLQDVLLAYARRNPEIGYCQGMNMIAANLLLIMPTAEDAFWILASLIENILPEKYYDHSLLTSRADQHVLRHYVSSILPQLSKHLESLGIELEALSFQWFLSVFTDCLSAEALFRVWDVILCINGGSVFLFQVALALLKLNEQQLLRCESPAEVYEYINQRMTDHAISIDGLIKASDGLKKVVKNDEILRKRQQIVEEEREITRQRDSSRKQTGKPETGCEDAGVAQPNSTGADEDVMGELEERTPIPVDEGAS